MIRKEDIREVYDIEVLRSMFYFLSYDFISDKWYSYEITTYNNELYALIKHITSMKVGISYNGISYDGQILQYIIDNYERWVDYSNQQIISVIKKFSDRIIEDGRYGLFPPYKEESLDIFQIDVFKIHHFDNEAKMTSLKWLQFSMDFYNVEEMPIHHNVESLSLEDVEVIKSYCRNDVESTYQVYLYTIGAVDHELYRGFDKIQDRFDIIEAMKFPAKALSWSDVKIGDEINKKVYCGLTGRNPNELKSMRPKGRIKGFTYGQCIPEYVKFTTSEFISFHERIRKQPVNLYKKIEYPFTFNKTRYAIAKGGIHSNEKNRIIEAKEDEILEDSDIGSQYPTSFIKRRLYPKHLGEAWLVGYTQTRNTRLVYKDRIKEDRKYKGLSEMYKLALNGGGFGKTNEISNWQYDPFVHFSCTIGNQFEILMLIEMLEIAGIHVVSANTDGIMCLYSRDKEKLHKEICEKWEIIVGNEAQGKLEHTKYKKIVQSSVNHYLAIKEDGKLKKKGEFATYYELNKDKSHRVIPMALEEYFVNGTPVKEFIEKQSNIFDFCIGIKISRNFHYEMRDRKLGTIADYNKLLRYIISNKGEKLFRIKNENAETNANEVTQMEAGDWLQVVTNKIDNTKKIEEYGIRYEYYTGKAESIIYGLQGGNKKGRGTRRVVDPAQQSLF